MSAALKLSPVPVSPSEALPPEQDWSRFERDLVQLLAEAQTLKAENNLLHRQRDELHALLAEARDRLRDIIARYHDEGVAGEERAP